MADIGADLAQASAAAVAHIRELEATIADLRQQLEAARPPILWGANVWRFGTETFPQALARAEKALGRLQVVRHFATDPVWPTGTGDRLLHVSFKWAPADVLAGKRDAAFKAWCDRAPDRPTWWSYWHEPEDEIATGKFTAADYRAAWRRLAGIARASGKDLRATLTLMSWSLEPASRRNWTDYYPGADVIDVLAWDAYHSVSGHTDPAKVYAACRRVSVEAGKPWAVAETGVNKLRVPDPAERARLLTALARDLSTVQPRPVFVTYFDTHNPAEAGGTMPWDISHDPAMAHAWLADRLTA